MSEQQPERSNQRFDGRSIRLSREEAEFLVDACEKTRIPQWMQLAAEIRSNWGMGAYPAGAAIVSLRTLLIHKRLGLMVDETSRNAQFQKCLDRASTLMESDPEPDSPEGIELDHLSTAIALYEEIKYPIGLSPLEQLFIEWWTTDMDDAEFFNRAVRENASLSEALSKACQK